MKKVKNEKIYKFLAIHGSNILSCLRLTHFKVYFSKATKEELIKYSPELVMFISVRYDYNDATIKVNEDYIEKDFKNKDYWAILEYLTHEICHILINRFEKDPGLVICSEHVESTTEHISRWAIRLYKHYVKECKINLATGNVLRDSKTRNHKRRKKVAKP